MNDSATFSMTGRDRNVTVDMTNTVISSNNKSKRYNWHNEEDVEILESELNTESDQNLTTESSDHTINYLEHMDRKLIQIKCIVIILIIILVSINLGILWITLHCKVGNGCSYNINDLLQHWKNSEYIRMYAVLNIILIMMYFIPVVLYVPLTYKSLMILRQINY